MKRFFTLALALTIISGTAFSKAPIVIKQSVLNSFSKKFTSAEDVRWEIKKDLYRAQFKLHGQTVYAYYNANGEQVALSRNISVYQLPFKLATDLQSSFKQSWLTELFEVCSNEETAYYATVETSTHITVYRAEASGDWTIFRKDKKED